MTNTSAALDSIATLHTFVRDPGFGFGAAYTKAEIACYAVDIYVEPGKVSRGVLLAELRNCVHARLAFLETV